MRKLLSLVMLLVIALGLVSALSSRLIGAEGAKRSDRLDEQEVNFGRTYNSRGVDQTGAPNIVASVVVTYRGFDTLGEVTILFIAAIGLAALLQAEKKTDAQRETEPASLIVFTGCRFLFPLIMLFGTYIFMHGHLTPGGGFQGGAIIASGFLLIVLGCRGKELAVGKLGAVEAFSGLFFVVVGLIGLGVGGSFLFNFLPKGTEYALFSAGVIPVIYVLIGFKVGSELGGIVASLAGGAK